MTHITVSSDVITKAAAAYIEICEDFDEKLENEVINTYLGKRYWWNLWVPLSRDRVVEELEPLGYIVDRRLWSRRVDTKLYSTARRLLLLAKHGDPITLSLGDAWILDRLDTKENQE